MTEYVGHNIGYIMLLGEIGCSGGRYYDRVSGMCYDSYSGGTKSCNGMVHAMDTTYSSRIDMYNMNAMMMIVDSNTGNMQW